MEIKFTPFSRQELDAKLTDYSSELREEFDYSMREYELHMEMLKIASVDPEHFPILHSVLKLQTKRFREGLDVEEREEYQRLMPQFKESLKAIASISHEAHAHYKVLFPDEE